jgi:hypothetical protein
VTTGSCPATRSVIRSGQPWLYASRRMSIAGERFALIEPLRWADCGPYVATGKFGAKVMVTRIEIDDLADQVPEPKRAEFVDAAWAATVLCWDDIPRNVRDSICRRTAMLMGLKYPTRQS